MFDLDAYTLDPYGSSFANDPFPSDGFPELGESSATLGVRPDRDVKVDANGNVEPESGGMSVTPDCWKDVPHHLLPQKLGGDGRHPLFLLTAARLPRCLVARVDKPRHANVEPTSTMLVEDFQSAIQATRSDWSLHERK